MKNKRIIFLICLALAGSGCNPNGIFYELKSFKSYDAAEVHGRPSNIASVKEISRTTKPTLSFFALGCAGTGNPGQFLTAQSMIHTAKELPPDLVVYLGDNFYGRGVSSVTDPQWQQKFERVYHAKKLSMPFYAVLGNHDYHKNPQAQVEYSKTSVRWRMPSRYYTFQRSLSDGTEIEFFAIDTMEIVSGKGAEQLTWLEAKLRASRADWKIVMGHHPVYSYGAKYKKQTEKTRSILEPIFIRTGVHIYLSAHNHNIEILKPKAGISYIVSGAGSRPRDVYWTEDTQFAHADLGFVGVRIFKEKAEVYVIEGRHSELLSKTEIPKKEL